MQHENEAPWLALRNAIGVAVPLAIGAAATPPSGLIDATGALNVAFSDGSEPYRHRLRHYEGVVADPQSARTRP
ncbi:MAG TPA: hypothetical protein VGZ73_02705 [Bryobacteraceae bacterium]|nr:hypothetical protein [Bryobacteraceae bacterium]